MSVWLCLKAATFLLNTGRTTNLLSRHLSNTLNIQKQMGLEPYKGA